MAYVTDRELVAHLEPIKSDIHEIKSDVKILVGDKYGSAWLGGKGQAIFVAIIPAIIAGAIAAAIALLIN